MANWFGKPWTNSTTTPVTTTTTTGAGYATGSQWGNTTSTGAYTSAQQNAAQASAMGNMWAQAGSAGSSMSPLEARNHELLETLRDKCSDVYKITSVYEIKHGGYACVMLKLHDSYFKLEDPIDGFPSQALINKINLLVG